MSSKKAKPEQTEKDKKAKLVRDSFTIPKSEYAALEQLKTRALGCGVAIKKSELLRAGLMALNAMTDAGFKSALAAVPTLKTGRPTQQDSQPAAKPPAPAAASTAKTTPARKTPAAAKPPAKKAAAKTTAPATAPAAAKRAPRRRSTTA